MRIDKNCKHIQNEAGDIMGRAEEHGQEKTQESNKRMGHPAMDGGNAK